MDRRQKKTKDAIFKAFTTLLSKKNYNQISVQEIIDIADIGRTTFYAHFETKEYLLKDLCEELFGHIMTRQWAFRTGIIIIPAEAKRIRYFCTFYGIYKKTIIIFLNCFLRRITRYFCGISKAI